MPTVTATTTKDNLEVNVQLAKQVTVLSGQTLSRGDLVRYDGTATTKVIVQDATAGTSITVMLEDVDATAGDVVGLAMRRGEIKASAVAFGGLADGQAVRDVLDAKGIYLVD